MYIPEKDTILNEVIAAYDFPETLLALSATAAVISTILSAWSASLRRVMPSALFSRACLSPHSPGRTN